MAASPVHLSKGEVARSFIIASPNSLLLSYGRRETWRGNLALGAASISGSKREPLVSKWDLVRIPPDAKYRC